MKKNKNKNIVIIILTILLVGVSIVAILALNDTISLKKDNNISENNDLPEWASYLLKQNITKIVYETGLVDDSEKCVSGKTLTKEQLKDILLKMTKSKLSKYDAGGFGGPCYEGITITYDNKKFEIFMGKRIIADNNDINIINLLEKENYVLDSQVIADDPLWTYEYNWDTTYIDTMLNK